MNKTNQPLTRRKMTKQDYNDYILRQLEIYKLKLEALDETDYDKEEKNYIKRQYRKELYASEEGIFII